MFMFAQQLTPALITDISTEIVYKPTLFTASFWTALDFRAGFFWLITVCFRTKMDGIAVGFNTSFRWIENPRLAFNPGVSLKQSLSKCSLHNTDEAVGCHSARVR